MCMPPRMHIVRIVSVMCNPLFFTVSTTVWYLSYFPPLDCDVGVVILGRKVNAMYCRLKIWVV